MNKLVSVLGVAAVATLAGCKDPNYRPYSSSSQNEVKDAAPAPAVEVIPEKPTCKCPPGTKHAYPCTCGAPDCQCIVETKPVVVVPPPAPEPAYTTYIVQNGDYLAKISKKYNVTISSIKRLNGMKDDNIRVGQKLKLPGKIDVGVQKAPAKSAPAKKAAARAVATEYTGATKEYVVKSGDTLGAIAYGNGCNIRQLKKLNGLASDALKVGQKLKVPADAKAAAAKTESPKAVEKKASVPKAVEKPVEPAAPAPVSEPAAAAPAPAAPAAEVASPAPAAPAAAEPATSTFVVGETDDMTGVTIRFGVTAAAIRELNNLPEDAQLRPGQVIKLPADAQQ